MEHIVVLLTALRLATVALGIVFLWGAWRSYLRFRSGAMLWLVIAVGLLVAAVLAEGFVVQVLGRSLDVAHVVEAAVSLFGFGALVMSVHGARRGRRATDAA